jgi:thymidylate kinase
VWKPALTIISFSGIDGAGKSTQIQALETWLAQSGFEVTNFSMWDDVVVGARWRELASRCAFGGDQGVGRPENPLERRDKNVTSWPLEIIRLCLYVADAVSLLFRPRRLQRRRNHDVVVFDRYIYDELANLRSQRPLARFVIRLILKLVPSPDFACVIDVVPEVARSRKPEYPLEFLHRNREAYLRLREFAQDLTVIENSSVEETAMKIRAAVLPILSRPRRPENSAAVAMPD